ncbi:MAG: DedA family protein [Candidatus Marinimicrobia bacterium]|nr:DedA family protein [Candidatus Neomarinimicrobiota bacterium]
MADNVLPATPVSARPNPLRRLYDWVLHWAETPYGAPALFLLAFAESSFFPIPPDILLIALAISLPSRAFWFAALCTGGSIAGAFLGYGIGYFGWEAVGKPLVVFYQQETTVDWIRTQYETYGFWGVFLAALTPIPYKVFTIASGLLHFNLGTFAIASILGRGLRFFGVGALIYFSGPPIKGLIDKHFNLMAVVFAALLVGGFVVITFWI